MLNFRIIDNDSNTAAGSKSMFCKAFSPGLNNEQMMGILTIYPRKQATVAISNQAIKFCGEEFTTVGIPHYELRKNRRKSI